MESWGTFREGPPDVQPNVAWSVFMPFSYLVPAISRLYGYHRLALELSKATGAHVKAYGEHFVCCG
jgi:hypothetical protein